MKKMMGKMWQAVFVLMILGSFLSAAFAAAEENPYNRAVEAYLQKDYKTAVTYLREYVEKKPDPYAYYLLGYALYKMKKHAESAKYFDEAYVLDPNISPLSVKKKLEKK